MLMLISTKRLTPRAMQLFERENIPMRTQFAAHGTAKSDMMDILGLGGIEKDVFAAVLSKDTADAFLKVLFSELELGQKNSGIAYTIPLSGISSLFMKLCVQEEEAKEKNGNEKGMENMSENKYSVIAATVNQGYSEEVMNAAREAGARGGTVFHNNCIVADSAANLRGADFCEERETVLIIIENEKKLDVMRAITDACGIPTEAKGVVISMPIDNIMGLNS